MVEAPIVIGDRKELTYLLCQAAELEHGLMCEYLYAAFSLKQGEAEGVPGSLVDTVEGWRREVLAVAAQEMLHWALLNNLLTAVGSAPFVSRPHLPHRGNGYPTEVQLALLPFGERALRHFLYLERPEGMDADDAEGFEHDGPALPAMSATDIIPRSQEYSTVGHLYRSIDAGLVDLAGRFGEDGLFIGPQRQATAACFGWPELEPLVNLATARGAIARIVEQGEGCWGDWRTGHYGRFLAVLDDLGRVRDEHPDFEPAHPNLHAGVRAVDGHVPAVLITDPATAAVTDLFDAVYDLLLQIIVRFFAFGEETDDELHTLADTAVQLMFTAIRPLGLLLARMPVGPEHPGRTAGADFQLAYRSSFLLPHKGAAWIRFAERLDELAGYADAVDAPAAAGATLGRVAGALRTARGRLLPAG